MKKVRKVISTLITAVLFIALLGVGFIVISSKASGGQPSVFGYQLKTVLSGSMEPGIQTGSIIAVKPGGDASRYKKGDVITFKSGEKLITHRIQKVNGSGNSLSYTTKGDNNNAADPDKVLPGNVVAEYTGFTVPYIGYGMDYAQSKKGTMILMIVPGVLLLLYSIWTITKAIREIDVKKEKSSTPPVN
ncbi:signal peptidase I [Fictibacillus macauensis ZFHKF-1]|uniref:Signal peptidase I n=1 Tax=Fictibacillus macauensis ZFHKF-1 TaxID=1196324 RepID=I8AJD9_9BACL|nr:signal peptidase I [Fictibacillus macauensis]EIT85624.1 signal peptidase I [Fictibacillus macauensis ZFHKF-1]